MDEIKQADFDSPPILDISTSKQTGGLGDHDAIGLLVGTVDDEHQPSLMKGEATDPDSDGEFHTSNSFAILESSFALEAEACPFIDRPCGASPLSHPRMGPR